MLKFIAALAVLTATGSLWGASFYSVRLDDPQAVYLEPGDGSTDQTAAIQQAIDKVEQTTRQGIIFIPEGRYRLTNTVYVWPGIRLIGYGARRPVFVLPPNTPGYGDPDNVRYMIFFSGGHGNPPRDASPGTFYSAISNIDIEIGDGNPGAAGVRAHYAQHCYLAHMDFRIGSGFAGIDEAGNVAEDVHFHGGRYGVRTGMPSPGWQFTMVDVTFDGQREAAIREREAGLTLIRPQFRGVPTAIAIDPDFPDELWIRDGRMEDITGPAVIISAETRARTEINMEGIVCRHVPVFAAFRESARTVKAPAAIYEVKTFSHGVHFDDIGATPTIRDIFENRALDGMPEPVKSDLPDLPDRSTWVNIRSLGAKGDGASDDTAIFRKAIAENTAIYVPSGRYIISDTLLLRPDTALIGLHPSATQIDLLDSTPGFQGLGSPRPMIETPRGGRNILTGIGVYTNGINPRAVAVKWMAGADSMMNDARMLGGHGTMKPDGSRENPYNNTHTADPDTNRRWDSQYPSLWVTDGGGGTFFDIWTPSTFAQAGMLVSNTSTEGRVYEMSSEHHVRHEIQLHNVSNWRIYALQTEEERGESGFALPLEITGSSNITVANFHIYRVISSYQPFPWAIRIAGSKNIRLRNIHCWSNSKVAFDDAVYDQTHNVEIRRREFAWLDLLGTSPAKRPVASGPRVEKLAGGFFNISGGAVSPAGDFYFVDAHWQRIYCWSVAEHRLSTVADSPLDPVNLAFDKSGNLLVVSYAGKGTVYAFRPGTSPGDITLLKPEKAAARPGATLVLAVGDYRLNTTSRVRAWQYVSPDGSTFISATDDFVNGATSWGIKSADLLRGFGLAPAAPGKPFYLTDESEMRTWSAAVAADGSIGDPKLFAEQGGEGVTADSAGNVYIAAGQVYVYNPAGKLLETIEVPERPLQVVFGGRDRRTLFIAARTALYAMHR